MIGPFYRGQIPARAMVLQLRDQKTNQPLNLDQYDGADILMNNPNGEAVDTSQGVVSILAPQEGKVRYLWPVTSLFDNVGDYTLQVKLTSDSALDYTIPTKIEVYKSLEE